MPSGRPRTPSRGRPSKKGNAASRSQSASRKAKSPPKKQQKKKSKSPQKATPKPRSASRSRKVATAPAAVSGKRHERSSSRRSSLRAPSSRGTPRPMTSITVSTISQSGPKGSASPPMLRSRALGAAIAQQITASQKSPMAVKRGPQKSWGQALRNNIVTQKIGKMGAAIKRGPRPMIKSTINHLKANWKYWLLALVFLLLTGLIYKFQRELLTNVQQINKQIVEFVQQQYEQQQRIFGEYWLKMEEALAKARLKYLTQPPPLEQSPTSTPPSQLPPPKPTRTPHLTDDTF